MRINTTRFGDVDISDKSVIRMPEGMSAFETCKRYVLLEDRPESPFKWLQAVDDPALAFIVTDPMEFFDDYEIELSEADAELLNLKDASNAAIMTTVTVDKEKGWATTNLLGPIVVNSKSLRAKQIVLGNDKYHTKHRLAAKMNEKSGAENEIAA